MALYKVDSDTADLTKVAGGTLYADLPVGSWIKNDMDTLPSGFLKQGDTISQSEYPELYAKYGSTVPYKADTSELSEWETSDFANNTDKTMPYDGVGMISNGNDTEVTITVNGVVIGRDSGRSAYASSSLFFQFKKNDVVKFSVLNGSITNQKVAYYKKSLIVKAKHTPIPVDFMDAVDDVIKDTTVDEVANGDMNPITSNAVYDEFKRVQPRTYECSGFLINSLNGEITGYGRATVTLKEGIAEIKFSARIHTNTMTSTFSWGLNRDLLRTLIPSLPQITPISTNSNLIFFTPTGAAYIDNMGYGAMASGENQFWIPGRMYTTDGDTGIWGSDQFPINSYITGTVYGTYTV